MKHVKLIAMMKPFLRYFMLKNQAAWFVKSFWGHNSRTRFFHDTPFSKKLGRPLVLSCSEKNFARRNNISKKTRKFSFFGLPDPEWLFYFSNLYVQKKSEKTDEHKSQWRMQITNFHHNNNLLDNFPQINIFLVN